MAERDQTPVVIRLNRQRAYRRRDEDTKAVWVGPGRVTVPKWVAEHWGATILRTASATALAAPPPEVLTPNVPPDGGNAGVEDDLDDDALDADGEPTEGEEDADEEGEAEGQASAPPLEGYDQMTVDQVLFAADSLDDEGRARVVAYEKAHKNRKTIIEELE